MTRRIALLTAISLLAVAVAACGSSSNGTTSSKVGGASTAPTAVPSQAASATPSTAPSTAAPTGPLASIALPSFDLHGAPDLEATLPGTIGSQQTQKYSFSLAQLSALGQASGSDQTFIQWVQSLGKNPSDVTMAVAYTTGSPSLTAGAMKVNGVDQSKLISSFQAASQQSGQASTQATIGGKQVLKVTDSESPTDMTYAYAKGDTLYFAVASDDPTAATILQTLP